MFFLLNCTAQHAAGGFQITRIQRQPERMYEDELIQGKGGSARGQDRRTPGSLGQLDEEQTGGGRLEQSETLVLNGGSDPPCF